jgi:hypothetical protein
VEEETVSEEQALRFEMASLRADMYRVNRLLRHWFLVGAAILLAALAVFVSYVSAAGLDAIRENTRALARVRAESLANREMLDAVRRDLESSGLRFEVIRRQLEAIEERQPQEK